MIFNDGTTSDVNDDLDSSFGEFSGDTRVSKYVKFIDESVFGGYDNGPGEPKCSPGKAKRNLC